MTSKLILVGSSIQPRPGKFTYSPTRSHFSADERFRQTIFTINSLRNSFPDAKIAVIDSSDDYSEYLSTFQYFKNTEFIPLKELDYNAFEIVNTHPNKSLCESVLLNTYYNQYKKEILSYDYHIHACGRYFYWDLNDRLFTEENKDKIFFKRPLVFPWNSSWRYSHIDLRHETGENVLKQYCTVLYAFGTQHLHKFIDINEASIHLTQQRGLMHYDIETLSYYLTRHYKDVIIETDWRVCGWDGTSGRFMYY
jgi:hypothetical protein